MLNTGAEKWVWDEADYIGSSPDIADDLNLCFIGLEFGLPGKRGGIAAIDIHTGKTKWSSQMPAFTHASPLYLPKTKEVAIGSNDGCMYLFDAEKGVLKMEVYDPRRKNIR